MRKLIKEMMENKVVNFVGLNKVVLGIKWNNEMRKRRLSDGWIEYRNGKNSSYRASMRIGAGCYNF